jgi:hypothetical protein
MHLIDKDVNNKKNYILKITILLVFYCFLFYVCSFSQEKSMSRPAIRDIPSLSIEIHQIQKSIISSFDIDVILSNLTKDKSYDVKQVKILIPKSLNVIRNDSLKEDLGIHLHSLNCGSEKIYRMGIPRVKQSILKTIFDTETLIFPPGSYPIKTEVVLKESGSDEFQSIYATTLISLEPPLNAILRGGIIGALLLALFIPTYKALRSKSKTKKIEMSLFSRSLILFIAGSVVATIAILLIHRFDNLSIPITIEVNDFLGGIIVGLFSYSIGNKLYEQLFGSETDPE